MTDSYNRDEVVAFWRSTGLENKHKRREIEKLAQLTGAHVDHIKPLRAGGPDLWFNLQVLSGTRNTSKGANFPEIDQREYEKRWTALPEDYKVAVQAAIDGTRSRCRTSSRKQHSESPSAVRRPRPNGPGIAGGSGSWRNSTPCLRSRRRTT